jgi:bacteriorhodopsin
LEFIVQIIEGTFYVWLLYNFNNVVNVTPNRYFDWAITTPTMLVQLIFYLIYLHNKNNGTTDQLEFFKLFNENLLIIIQVLLLNWLMLLFGYLGEINVIPMLLGTILGFIPFLIYYYIIYINYATLSESGWKIFLYFFFFWSLYGVASAMPYYIKNSFYNILDLFAKNFFGIFLSYLIFSQEY